MPVSVVANCDLMNEIPEFKAKCSFTSCKLDLDIGEKMKLQVLEKLEFDNRKKSMLMATLGLLGLSGFQCSNQKQAILPSILFSKSKTFGLRPCRKSQASSFQEMCV